MLLPVGPPSYIVPYRPVNSYTDFARRLLFCGLLFRPSVCHAFAVCHKMWPYRRDFDAANLSKKFKCKNEPCRTIFRG